MKDGFNYVVLSIHLWHETVLTTTAGADPVELETEQLAPGCVGCLPVFDDMDQAREYATRVYDKTGAMPQIIAVGV